MTPVVVSLRERHVLITDVDKITRVLSNKIIQKTRRYSRVPSPTCEGHYEGEKMLVKEMNLQKLPLAMPLVHNTFARTNPQKRFRMMSGHAPRQDSMWFGTRTRNRNTYRGCGPGFVHTGIYLVT